jgi:hypothetical protein
MFSSRIINSKQLRTIKSLIIIVNLNLKMEGYIFYAHYITILLKGKILIQLLWYLLFSHGPTSQALIFALLNIRLSFGTQSKSDLSTKPSNHGCIAVPHPHMQTFGLWLENSFLVSAKKINVKITLALNSLNTLLRDFYWFKLIRKSSRPKDAIKIKAMLSAIATVNFIK